MKVILIFVSSLDGKVTRWGEPNVNLWSSHQDQDYYKRVRNESRLVVMGSHTYKADHTTPSPNHRYIVLTQHPETYKSQEIKGQLEFTSESPSELITHLQRDGYDQMLLIGGPHVATSFLKEQLIDEVWLTIEPKIFGAGQNFVTEEKLDVSLRLLSFEKVNEHGTLITKYEVVRAS